MGVHLILILIVWCANEFHVCYFGIGGGVLMVPIYIPSFPISLPNGGSDIATIVIGSSLINLIFL